MEFIFFNIELKIKKYWLQISKPYLFLNFQLIPTNTTIILSSIRGIISELHTDPLLTFIIFFFIIVTLSAYPTVLWTKLKTFKK